VSRAVTHPALDLSEKEWQQQLVALARTLGWDRVYHTHDSRRSAGGFPDLVLVRDRVIFAELKRETTKQSMEQEGWLDALAKAGSEVYVWRPSDLDEAARVLSKRWVFEPPADALPPHLDAYPPYLFTDSDGLWEPKSLWRSPEPARFSSGKGPPTT
jgi:hypothetical protein